MSSIASVPCTGTNVSNQTHINSSQSVAGNQPVKRHHGGHHHHSQQQQTSVSAPSDTNASQTVGAKLDKVV